MIDLATLRDDPARVAELPVEAVVALLVQIAAEQSANAALQHALAARLLSSAQPAASTGDGGDRLLTTDEVMARTTLSKPYLYRHAERLPFFVRRAGRKLLFSEARLARWADPRRR